MPVNDQIVATQVRLIGEDGAQLGIMSLDQALKLAEQRSLDLVQMAEGEIVVCKLMNYGRYLFERKKQDAETRRKRKRHQLKEVKFRLSIDTHDYNVKLRSVRGFLDSGDRVKATVRFRGREIARQDLGLSVLKQLSQDTQDIAKVEQEPLMEGRQMIMTLISLGKKHKKSAGVDKKETGKQTEDRGIENVSENQDS